jgi:hypothetical protein
MWNINFTLAHRLRTHNTIADLIKQRGKHVFEGVLAWGRRF